MIAFIVAAWCLLPPSRVERKIVESLFAPRTPCTPRTEEQRSEDRRAFAVVGIYFSVAAVCLITAQHIFGA
jgi:hypothetical protein